MSVIVNKNYYFLATLLFGTFVVPVGIQAKPATSHSVSAQDKTSGTTDMSAPDDQIGQITLPKINKILFSGNTIISSDTLKNEIPLKVNDIANEHVIMDSMVKIAQLYKVKNTKITISPILEKTSLNTRTIQFEIHEIPVDEKKDQN